MVFQTDIKSCYIGLLQVPFEIAIVLCTRGASNSTADIIGNTAYRQRIMTEIGVGLCSRALWQWLSWWELKRQTQMDATEQRLLQIIAVSIPFLFLRLLYTTLIIFYNGDTFKTWNRNVIALGVMTILPEVIVVVIYIIEGFTLDQSPKVHKRRKGQKGRRRGDGLAKLALSDDALFARGNLEAELGKGLGYDSLVREDVR